MTSLWQDTYELRIIARSSVQENISVDVAIIGAGLSGLWTAYYLKNLQPSLRIAIFEANRVGFGASGRNGGWCSGFLPSSLSELSQQHSRSAAIDMYRQGFATIDEIQQVLTREQVDCDLHRGGTVHGATNDVQIARVKAEVAELQSFGFKECDMQLLSASEASRHLNISGLRLASFTPHCAVIHPAKLVNGLATVVEKHGVKIFENSPVSAYKPKQISVGDYQCRADVIVRATEGYTARIKGHRRDLAPLYSYMVATEPLSQSQLATINWSNRETYHDARNMIIYSQLTKDNRIAFGGRGAPYHFASRVKSQYDNHSAIHDKIIRSMHQIFPITKDVVITHKWGGPLGVPRNWQPSVNYDERTGLASLGGYVGDGVAASNLAGRTLAHCINRDGHDLTKLAWVNNISKNWELEPLRYIGINGLLKISESIDRHEKKTNKPDRIRSKILETFLG